MTKSTLEDRIVELEIQLAHLQRMFDQLDEVVVGLSSQNDRFRRQIDELTEQVKELKQKPESAPDPLDEKPPHY